MSVPNLDDEFTIITRDQPISGDKLNRKSRPKFLHVQSLHVQDEDADNGKHV